MKMHVNQIFKVMLYSHFFVVLACNYSPANAQRVNSNPRPSLVRTAGYSVSTIITSGVNQEVNGNQLEADNSISVNLINPETSNDKAGDLLNFNANTNSSSVSISDLKHVSMFEFGEGTELYTRVKTKDDAISEVSTSEASSSAFIIVETTLNAKENINSFAKSFDQSF